MATVIKNRTDRREIRDGSVRNTQILPDVVAALLPPLLVSEIWSTLCRGDRLEELRLRRGCRASLTVNGSNRLLSFLADDVTMEKLLLKLCDGSLYAHSESLRQGYVTVGNGVRVGICGRAVTRDERVDGVYDVSAFNFRFPCATFRCGDSIVKRILEERQGLLIYSPPGEGKTTLLRSLILQMARGESGLRVSVIDTREELRAGMDRKDLMVDWFFCYPKSVGMEIAVRCMRPEILVCDEIGDEEAETILGAQNAGVPLLATAHASSVLGLLRRPGFERLHGARVFEAYVGIQRIPGSLAFQYQIMEWEEADERLQHRGKHASPSVWDGRSAYDESLR